MWTMRPVAGLRSGLVALAGALVWLGAGCGDGGGSKPDAAPISLFDAAPPDAAPPDAFVCTKTMCGTECVDLETDPRHCGACDNACPPAADCAAPDCVCPSNFVPAAPGALFSQMNTEQVAPDILGLMVFAGTDGNAHALIAMFAPDVATGVDIDLASADAPTIGFGYQVDTANFTLRSGFLATSGTLRLDHACAEGVAGTVTGAKLEEYDVFSMTPVTDGCAIDDVDVTFAIGADCAPTPDAGPADAGPADAGPADAGSADAGSADAGSADAAGL
ncbi:MAG: hypothetical protein D6689_14605 [Deltaproteobacteria bacterium]|nr:MAG: hypothetical protein D6689_14605 [Deltaproteobacteria bacterium]